MKTYNTSIEIAATAERTWSALTDGLHRDPVPFRIQRLEGQIAQGSRIKLWSDLSPNRAFKLHVTVFDAPHKMVWRSGMPFGLFSGERTFLLSPRDGKTRFDMQEIFRGVLSGMIVKSIPDLTPSFEKFAQTLKEKAENHD
ncbi:MAG: SRPBCC domain-containing protein [Pseudomonadota bacterium]